MIVGILLAIGISAILRPFLSVILSLYYSFRRLNLKRLYGSGWAIVTGATDGIGFGFCQELAAQGFSVCLISRSGDKLEQKIQELKGEFGDKVEYRAIVADFKESFREGFFGNIGKQLDDIAQPVILVNNVGISDILVVK
jgi:short-subunit dehydrogenase